MVSFQWGLSNNQGSVKKKGLSDFLSDSPFFLSEDYFSASSFSRYAAKAAHDP
jgi:hypothetical protein